MYSYIPQHAKNTLTCIFISLVQKLFKYTIATYVGGCYIYWVTIQLKNLLLSQHSLCSIACSRYPSHHRFTCVSYKTCSDQYTKSLNCSVCCHEWAARFGLGPQNIFSIHQLTRSHNLIPYTCFSTFSPDGTLQVDTRMGGSCPG